MSKLKLQVKAQVLKSLINNRKIPIESFADKSRVPVEQLRTMVTTDSEIEMAHLERMAKVLKRPWTVFLLDKPEEPINYGQDHRTVLNNEHRLSPDVAQILVEANYILDIAEEINPDSKLNLPVITSEHKANSESLAGIVREYWGCSLDGQFELNDEYEALRYWKNIVQEAGIYISEKPLPINEVRAFSIRRDKRAIIVVSTKDHAYARIFSIFHELCHVILKDTGVCDLHDDTGKGSIEPFCNRFAASFLVPRKRFVEIVDAQGIKKGVLPNTDDIGSLSKAFRVSRLAIYTRLKNLGYISQIDYSKIYDERTNRGSLAEGRRSGGNYYRTAINSAGRKFSEEVFVAHSEGKLSYNDVGRALGVSAKNIGKLRESLFTAGNRHESAS